MPCARHNWIRRVLFLPALLAAVISGFSAPAQAQETQDPDRPLRFLQETPWTVSAPGALSSSMPVLAWWDSEAGKILP